MDLLAYHALRLGNQPGGCLPGNLQDDPYRFCSILRTMDEDAVRLVDRDELPYIIVQVVDHICPNVVGAFPSLWPVWNGLECLGTSRCPAVGVLI